MIGVDLAALGLGTGGLVRLIPDGIHFVWPQRLKPENDVVDLLVSELVFPGRHIANIRRPAVFDGMPELRQRMMQHIQAGGAVPWQRGDG